MSCRRLSLTLPLPPRELSPNARVHWGEKGRAARRYRETARLLGLEARRRAPALPTPPVTVHLAFHFPVTRRRDEDNARASFKAGQDGLVDAGLLPGDDAGMVRVGETAVTDRAERGRWGAGCVVVMLEWPAGPAGGDGDE